VNRFLALKRLDLSSSFLSNMVKATSQ